MSEEMRWKWRYRTHFIPMVISVPISDLLNPWSPSQPSILTVKSAPDICSRAQFTSLHFLLGSHIFWDTWRKQRPWLHCTTDDSWILSTLSGSLWDAAHIETAQIPAQTWILSTSNHTICMFKALDFSGWLCCSGPQPTHGILSCFLSC